MAATRGARRGRAPPKIFDGLAARGPSTQVFDKIVEIDRNEYICGTEYDVFVEIDIEVTSRTGAYPWYDSSNGRGPLLKLPRLMYIHSQARSMAQHPQKEFGHPQYPTIGTPKNFENRRHWLTVSFFHQALHFFGEVQISPLKNPTLANLF